jgi:hypothetical protein
MTPDPEVSPGEETEKPPEVVEPEKEETPVTEPEKVEEDERDKELKRLSRELRKAQRNNSRLHLETETLRKNPPAEKAEEVDVERLAEQKAEAKTYAKDAERIVETGKKSNADFIEVLRDLAQEVGPFVKPDGLPTPFMVAVRDISEDPAKLLYHLGKNPDVASELADLPVTKLAARLDRIEREMNATPKISSAPKPIEPVKPKATVAKDISDPKLSFEEFVKIRRRQIAQRH